MSLNITLQYINDDNKCVVYSSNITHNLNDMAKELGAYQYIWRPDENGIATAKELEHHLKSYISELKNNPDKYKKFNPSNGWGTYEYLLEFIENYHKACVKYPNANIVAER